jgi:type III secretion protein J
MRYRVPSNPSFCASQRRGHPVYPSLRPTLKLAAALLLLALTGCREDLYRGLSQRDANEMSALLLERGIEVERLPDESGRMKILVETSEFPRAVEALSRAGYPKESFSSIAEVFPGDGIIVSPFEQRARLMYALGQELSRTVSAIDGVVSARVHVAVPEEDVRISSRGKPSASVLVRIRPEADPASLAARIRSLVARGVPDLSVEDVSISFDSAMPEPASAAPGGPVQVVSTGGAAAAAAGEGAAPGNETFPTATILWLGAAALLFLALVAMVRARLASRKQARPRGAS